jgi:hypothetical protein
MRALGTLLSLFSLISSIVAANIPLTVSHSNSQPTSGKSYYQIYLKDDTDTTSTSEFIQSIVGAENLFTWIGVNDRLMHWTVEASPEEVTQLKANKDIDRLDKSHPPLPSAVIKYTDDITISISLPNRQNPEIAWYGVSPTDGGNTTETSQTQKALQLLLGDNQIKPPEVRKDGLVYYWYCGCKSTFLPKPLPSFTIARQHSY